MLPSAHPTTSAPRCSLSRLITAACTLAVYASWLDDSLAPRKTRFRWVANPCRVGLGPTGSTTKGFGFCLLHVPSSLPRLRLAQGASLRYLFRGSDWRCVCTYRLAMLVLEVAYPFAPVGPDAVGGAEQILTALDAGLIRAGNRSVVIAQ